MQRTNKTSFALLLLIFFWCVGASLGILIANRNVDTLVGFLRMVYPRDGYVVAFSGILPILAVYLACCLRLPWLILPILFLKSITDSVILMGIVTAFGSAAWLAGSFLLFSDNISTVFLLYFAGKCLTERSQTHTACFLSVLIAIAVAVLFDCFCISPYFAALLL